MTATLTHIVRHPLKAIGREVCERVNLTAGQWMPGDRIWAVTHGKSRIEGPGWAPKVNFLRGVSGPSLMAATAHLSEDGASLTLNHPEAGPLTLHPDNPDDTPRLLHWLGGIWPEDLPPPTGLYRTDAAHLTDVPDPWLSIHNAATHRAVEQRLDTPLSIHRWRGNLWIEGLAPWQEFEWIGKTIRIGAVAFTIRERITRCKATMANPETGRRDADTLAALRSWDHQDFGVYAEVLSDGAIATGDPVEVPQ
ncbi:MOSC domain-containing protein [Ovoidimarina sediminis]|uniref:MOSC domain-containing protein n=1 Tax=Ovoidimarina sediminis TaxID=3079856 RepID=UPI00290CFEEB|nr:MOSC domain-containing protein [Rhodophyticola sp. MJ-SS7]MDU8946319.1 MOSC domain-containing protein [Rhodophyticola sp. MJ-SS7]